MNRQPSFPLYIALIAALFFSGHLAAQTESSSDSPGDGFKPLFNGKNLDGWQPVNTAESTWKVKDGMLICSGKPIGELRTKRMYQNFILEVEWRHMKPKGNAGIFVWADDITAKGVPFHRSIEVQVLENAYGNSRGHTTHGDIFPIHGAKMTPVNGRGGSRAFPTENRSKPSPEWNHYRIECRDGAVTLAVNHKVVTRGIKCSPSKGYICIESEGGIVHYRNMKIKELPNTPIEKKDVAIADRGYRSLYNGIDLNDFETTGKWQVADWRLRQQTKGSLSTKKKYGPGSIILDVVTSKSLPKVVLAGTEIDFEDFRDHFSKSGWNRIELTVKRKRISVSINGKNVKSEKLDIALILAPITITSEGSGEFANFYYRLN